MIVKLTKENLTDVNRPNQPYNIIGKLKLEYKDGAWCSEEVLSNFIVRKQNPNYDGAEVSDYINNPDRAIFLCYENGECVGQIFVARAWNRYAHIEDLSIAEAWRGHGIGTKLFETAVGWAKKVGLCGISLESQDVNIFASRFYHKMGMHIGAINTQLYRHLGKPYDSEIAVFWYLDFN